MKYLKNTTLTTKQCISVKSYLNNFI